MARPDRLPLGRPGERPQNFERAPGSQLLIDSASWPSSAVQACAQVEVVEHRVDQEAARIASRFLREVAEERR